MSDLCSICQYNIIDTDAFTLQCNHIYCNSCIKKSLSISNRCPLCRAVITDDDYSELNVSHITIDILPYQYNHTVVIRPQSRSSSTYRYLYCNMCIYIILLILCGALMKLILYVNGYKYELYNYISYLYYGIILFIIMIFICLCFNKIIKELKNYLLY
jgi:hypothetical protein